MKLVLTISGSCALRFHDHRHLFRLPDLGSSVTRDRYSHEGRSVLVCHSRCVRQPSPGLNGNSNGDTLGMVRPSSTTAHLFDS